MNSRLLHLVVECVVCSVYTMHVAIAYLVDIVHKTNDQILNVAAWPTRNETMIIN